ncbi:4-(cytidine 5'-diphospho)-2-C-methyl-D-erythritol kinase [Anaerocolumna sp. AGMB13025]|uniref:4-(cytidine 5'-diphospho)-2-C-methyl-D-erythritol kinase n=1 Tax=Anaerocolumna sp. AGMB13025 TaxID=3039116 RepID=UPI00241D108C|nr:4-(cytidine 5'-diphospho)-2-C-methyl-D-erythritol kinase [Anaerocolumna sp. AGMB13025]WFR57382.1 4-(cytidine 5'-diphospho)-2-C-methyl-D-erythritol kinase [Anaerocolumna sp. AGMB13025]
MNSIKLKAHAKINLGLDVVRRREDGYHEVRMIMQTIGLYDKLTINRTNNNSIVINTNLHYLPTDENNLVYKAVSLIQREYHIEQGVYINLEKKIPVAAGMAGGSTDAATALYGMSRLFDLNLKKPELMKLGLRLGADVPYCIMRGTALSEGIGEILTPLPSFPACQVLIVKPGLSVSTKYVYENLKLDETTKHPDINGILTCIRTRDLYGAIGLFGNVLENVTIKEYPVIGEIKDKMTEWGAIGALMSGSGPTVFGLFDDIKKAEKAFYQFKVSELGKQVFLTDLYQPYY